MFFPAPRAARAGARCFAAILLCALFVGAFARDARATRDRPPAAYTGGFGEPTCQACHFEQPVNSGPGRVRITGLPVRYTPGAAYVVTVVLVQPRMAAAGFELAARFEHDSTQAGVLSVPAGPARVDITVEGRVQYAHQVYDGSMTVAPDTARWQVLWTSPASGRAVRFHVAANAANDDNSPLGDLIYTASTTTVAGK